MCSLNVPSSGLSDGTMLKRSSTGLDKKLIEASPVEYEDKDERLNASLQIAWNSVMRENGHYKTAPLYKNVKCLLISWDEELDDLKTKKEVSDLGSLLEKTFHYKVTRAVLKKDYRHSPHLQLSKHIVDFITEEDDAGSLLIVYYAGHGRPKPTYGDQKEGLTLTSGRSLYEVDDEDENEIIWCKIEDNLQHAKADVLEIFDCCYAGDLTRGRRVWGRRSFEYLGACSSNNVTRSPGKSSFTTALIWALAVLAAEKEEFTVSELSRKIREAPGFPPDQVPVQFDRAVEALERIVLSPLKNTDDSPVATSDDTTPQGILHLNLLFATVPGEKTIRTLAKLLDHALKKGKFPITRIAWGGLSPWETDQPCNDFLIHKAIRLFKAGPKRRKLAHEETFHGD